MGDQLTYTNLLNTFKSSFPYPQSKVLPMMTYWSMEQSGEGI